MYIYHSHFIILFYSISIMWNNLPSDLLSTIFSYLPPHSLPPAMAVCRHWRHCATSTTTNNRHHPPWFIALPARITTTTTHLCFVHNPIKNTWHLLNLKHVPSNTKPISTIGGQGLILFKPTAASPLRLSVCNPFTGESRHLPPAKKPRINPVVGVIEIYPSQFNVYVAGGMSEAARGGAALYEPTLEMFDSRSNKWNIVGSMPVEFAVRLTVWTPNESVSSRGVIYWMTSARTYSIMGYEINTNKWKELNVPMGDTLDFAALVSRGGKVMVVGGTGGGNVSVWELGEAGEWNLIERMPIELGKRLVGGTPIKCVGIEGCVCLYREIGSEMVAWRRVEDNNGGGWEWCLIEGCDRVTGRRLANYAIKGLFLHPNLAFSSTFV